MTLWERLQSQAGGIGGPAKGVNAQAPAPAQTPAQAAPVPPPVQTYAQPPVPPAPVQAAPVSAISTMEQWDKARAQVPPAPAQAAPVPPPVSPAPTPPAPAQESANAGYLLLIDCVTDGAVLVSGLVDTAHERLKADAGVPHWRAIEYGKGSGVLCEYVREELAQVEPGAVLQVSTGADETGAILGMLETGAVQIIRGAR